VAASMAPVGSAAPAASPTVAELRAVEESVPSEAASSRPDEPAGGCAHRDHPAAVRPAECHATDHPSAPRDRADPAARGSSARVAEAARAEDHLADAAVHLRDLEDHPSAEACLRTAEVMEVQAPEDHPSVHPCRPCRPCRPSESASAAALLVSVRADAHRSVDRCPEETSSSPTDRRPLAPPRLRRR
jgi:hypothetical protein